MDKDLEILLNHLREKRGFDFSGYRPAMIDRRIMRRFSATGCKDRTSYLQYLQRHPDELDLLVDVLTINVTRFFRNTLAFDYMADRILPVIALEKKTRSDPSLRVWSAACATGEEAYSIAILIRELQRKEKFHLAINIFATDIDEKVLKRARRALYPYESIKNVKYRLLKRYFEPKRKRFQLIPKMREMVDFSAFDMMSQKGYAPPESVFGHFDIIFCKNLLIYFSFAHQGRIFDKLYRALTKGGYLVLGRAEVPTSEYRNRFRKVNECCPIYQKV